MQFIVSFNCRMTFSYAVARIKSMNIITKSINFMNSDFYTMKKSS